MTLDFTVSKGDYIELIQLLKVLSLAASGSEAKMLVDDGDVYLNGTQEFRRRAKVRSGDRVEVKPDGKNIIILIK
ncbi:MAG: RNA-binding S4 domain-containing protein [Prevotellaceae bacterium]|jgi:ribosome-associated protein|nr:RNA-binding S4 domain-containing protein [Prevotellaceae bacterium]